MTGPGPDADDAQPRPEQPRPEQPTPEQPRPEPVGSVAEEAFKLLRAVAAPGATARTSDDATAGHARTSDHVCSTGWCPVCQVVGVVRDHPEAVASVTQSAAALARSLRDLVDAALAPKEEQT